MSGSADVNLDSKKHKLVLRKFSKTFVSGRPVLRDVNLTISEGEIHALAGANGSGKSTTVKILAGYHAPDEGAELTVAGQTVSLPVNPLDIRKVGVRFVHQENGFISGMSILDNMCLGRGYSCGPIWKIKWREERLAMAAEIKRHNVVVDLDADAKTLDVATKAKLAIIRALYLREGEALNVAILDEPTAAMGKEEASDLGIWLRDLAARERIGVLFIGHRPQELREIADRISVLRNGEIVASFVASNVTNEDIVEALVGTRINSFYPSRDGAVQENKAALVVKDVKGILVRDASFSLYPGEIVGITGLQGSGFEELPYLLFDPTRKGSGTLVQGDESVNLATAKISSHISRGMVLVPNDRSKNSIVSELSIRENISQPILGDFTHNGVLSSKAETDRASEIAMHFGVTPVGVETKILALSGGNQQKVVVGKWMALSPKIIVLHEPTEGIDVAAKKDIFTILANRASEGGAILISSIEYEDLANVCDRILIFGHGKIHSELKGREITGEDVLRAAYQASLAESNEAEVKWT